MQGIPESVRRAAGLGRAGAAMVLAAWLGVPAGPARAATVVEPAARLVLEGGYDSNVYLDGRGGDRMGRVSPDVGVLVKDHLYRLGLGYGADLLLYPTLVSHAVTNHRGELRLDWRPARRWTAELDAKGTYTLDPVGLAQVGVLAKGGQALLLRGGARVAWRAEKPLRLALTFQERAVRFDDGTGAAAHVPGVEAAWILSERDELAAAYRLDLFRPIGATAFQGAEAHEAKAIYRRKLDRRYALELEGGPALWTRGGQVSVVPEGAATLLYNHRWVDLRFTAQHGLALGALAHPGLYDAVEAGVAWRAGRTWRLAADSGVWRGGDVPTGDNAVTGYLLGGELTYLFGNGLSMGVAASRFARFDDPSPAHARNLVGLRVGWELKPR
ncbi:hypothetical protein [Anaeromyxobacter paludicola]|uniref:Alginate export domain-containing protein n=1 Tax=Anaeromyxobacter paludicola TaxID=2918171 RepID=A0ABM7X8M4_9BACT|nr:hypothetical protein [Anaeromyxobacter paludicola]BDG08197.1 hypothetical protein AMPC_13100 [Anaeromyxobacter paludicola]